MEGDYEIEGKKVDITKADWDCLIILDACRYDMFAEVYRDVIKEGKLKKGISCAYSTPEFLFRVFYNKKLDDTIYVSGNGFINSKNVPIPAKLTDQKEDFNSTEHFKKVIDVWDRGWSKEYGTVHPEEMNKFAMVSMDLRPNMRHIIHYVQPHEPYIYYGGGIGGAFLGGANKKKSLKLKDKLNHKLNKYFSNETIWKMAGLIGALPENGKGMIFYKHGRKGFIKGYKEDLFLVLKYVKDLIERYPNKKFVITADHGEMLGEKGNYGHFNAHRNLRQIKSEIERKVLREVPWLEIQLK